MAFLAVCGLLGAGLGIVGLHIYSIVHGQQHSSGSFSSELVASGLNGMPWEAGSQAAIAIVVYLLAPVGVITEKPATGAGPTDQPCENLDGLCLPACVHWRWRHRQLHTVQSRSEPRVLAGCWSSSVAGATTAVAGTPASREPSSSGGQGRS